MKSTSNADIAVLPEETATSSILTPSCNYKKLCSNLSAYMDVSGQLRAKRKEVYEADQRRELKDQQAALDLSVEVAKLKHLSDRMRLLLCGQLREVINEIHQHLNITSKQTNDGSANAIETNGYTLELADKCTELLHSITFTAIKEEIYEKERLQSNALLHNGKSTAYIVLRSRWRVRPRSCHRANDTMSAEYKQQLSDKRFDSVRVKLLQLIKSHDALGYAMNEVRTQHAAERSRDAEADLVEADQHLVSFLRLIAVANKDMKQVEQQSSVSYLLAMQVLETAQRTNDIAEEFKAQCTYLRAQSRKQRKRTHPDDMPCLVILVVVVAVWYLFSR